MVSSILERAVAVIRSGGVVAVATDTLVGLLALARNPDAVARVLAVKGPDRRSPMPVLVPHLDAVLDVASEFPDRARERVAKEWPGPLTIVLPARPELPADLTAGRPTVGVRLPGPSDALDLVRAVGEPLTGTSANRSGLAPPANTELLDPDVADAVDLVWSGVSTVGRPSAVVDFTGE